MSTFRRKSDIRFRIMDGEAVVVLQDAAEVLVLNEVGTRILQLVDQGATEDQILAVLLGEFEVAPDELERDLREFLREMLHQGIVETVDPGADRRR
jgi:hypothetical protein